MNRRELLITSAVTGMLVFGLAVPASASPPGTTGATIAVTGGALAISVPTATVDLGTRADTVGGGTISGQLGAVQVTDARGAPAGSGWVASVISTAFTPPAGPAIPASDVSYAAGSITKVGTATYTADDPSDLTGVGPHRHRNRDHGRQLRDLGSDDQRHGARRYGGWCLLRDDHSLSCVSAPHGEAHCEALGRHRRCCPCHGCPRHDVHRGHGGIGRGAFRYCLLETSRRQPWNTAARCPGGHPEQSSRAGLHRGPART
jgi:hypothetical protein